jgi:type I restriction enzyme S subunit
MSDPWPTVALADVAGIAFSGVDKHIGPGETPVRMCNYLDVYRNRRLTLKTAFAEGSATAAEIRRLELRKGDVIITKDSETPDDIGVPALVEDELKGVVCGYHLALLRPDREKLESSFLLHHLQGDATKRHFLRTANGLTRFGLGAKAVASLPIALPSPDEQASITRILNAVDTALERTRAAAERARNLRRALMQDLLPAWIGLRDLGAEQLPAGVTDIARADSVADVSNGSTPSRADGRYWRHGTVPWLATGKVNERLITKANEFVTEIALRECSIRVLPRGTVLVGMIGQGRTRGMSAYLEIEACINQNFGAFVPKMSPAPRIWGKWLFYYLDYHYSRLREIGGGTNQGALNCYLLKRLRFPLVDLAKQKETAALLDAVDSLERSHAATLTRWAALKASLMHDLLTGRVRVLDASKVAAS